MNIAHSTSILRVGGFRAWLEGELHNGDHRAGASEVAICGGAASQKPVFSRCNPVIIKTMQILSVKVKSEKLEISNGNENRLKQNCKGVTNRMGPQASQLVNIIGQHVMRHGMMPRVWGKLVM